MDAYLRLILNGVIIFDAVHCSNGFWAYGFLEINEWVDIHEENCTIEHLFEVFDKMCIVYPDAIGAGELLARMF